MLDGIRAFFHARGVLEVETSLLCATTNPDPQVPSPRVGAEGARRWLQGSPEFAMKRLLAAGSGDIYQVCKAFRAQEQGRLHNPEFSILEWYRLGMDEAGLADELIELVQHIRGLLGGQPLAVRRLSYAQAFGDALDLDPHAAGEAALAAAAAGRGIAVEGALGRDAWLDLLLSHCVAPGFSAEGLTVLHDYPASQAALARVREDAAGRRVAARFEVYWGAVELANGFHELVDPAEQATRLEADRARWQGLEPPALDERLLAALRAGLPDCAGVALGLDRLLLCAAGAGALDEVLAFSWDRA
jgi:lysyl-tRNA synthetase class 2